MSEDGKVIDGLPVSVGGPVSVGNVGKPVSVGRELGRVGEGNARLPLAENVVCLVQQSNDEEPMSVYIYFMQEGELLDVLQILNSWSLTSPGDSYHNNTKLFKQAPVHWSAAVES